MISAWHFENSYDGGTDFFRAGGSDTFIDRSVGFRSGYTSARDERYRVVDSVYRVITDPMSHPDEGYDTAMALIAHHRITDNELNEHGDRIWRESRVTVRES